VARILRATPGLRDVHLVALSGCCSAEDRDEAARAGFELHLAKPVDPDLLGRMLAGLAPERSRSAMAGLPE